MNFGKTILDLRKARNMTQEDLAAQLGVTPTAVSKWENNITLPDILMLCALADCFEVTADELLGRVKQWKYAVIATASQELGSAIGQLAKRYGFWVKSVYPSYEDALTAAKADPEVTHLFSSFDKPMNEEEKHDTGRIISIESQAESMQQILDGFELYFKNMPAINSLATKMPIL